jgi:hypothetical protein
MALDQTGKIIPGIPLAALDAIADPGVRDVLRALVSTHNVRNNLAGSGSEAFITTRQALAAVRADNASAPGTAPRLLARYAHGFGGGPFGPGSLSDALTNINLSLDRAASFQALAHWQAVGTASGNTRIEVHNGTGVVLLSQSNSMRGGYADSYLASDTFRLEAGDYALTLHAGNDGSGSYSLGFWALLLLPVAA